jgi:hypothetical protein
VEIPTHRPRTNPAVRSGDGRGSITRLNASEASTTLTGCSESTMSLPKLADRLRFGPAFTSSTPVASQVDDGSEAVESSVGSGTAPRHSAAPVSNLEALQATTREQQALLARTFLDVGEVITLIGGRRPVSASYIRALTYRWSCPCP